MRSSSPWLLSALLSCALVGCPAPPEAVVADSGAGGGSGGGSGGDAGIPGGDAGTLVCSSCLTASDCGGAPCVQYAGSDYCGVQCTDSTQCAPGQTCLDATDQAGNQARVCVPSNGSCGQGGCVACAPNETCDPIAGHCVATSVIDAGQPSSDAGTCGSYVPPASASCCHSCTPGSSTCQANGCYGGWWCDSSACLCHRPPTTCGGSDAGTPVTGTDAGVVTGTVNADGGTVSRLYFAVVGDTRPQNVDQTSTYPTAIIQKIYADIQAMNPRPQFVLGTGDYMFASPSGTNGSAQMQLYLSARAAFQGPVFADLGNHECNGYTNGNCVGTTAANSNNYQTYLSSLVAPLGKAKPYYTVWFDSTDTNTRTKLIVVACNAWDATQKSWLAAELAKPSDATIISRHEPIGSTGPCNQDMDSMLQTATYNLLIVGHTHTYSHSGRELIVGNGGAPISGSASYGYALVEQLPGAGWRVTQYDYQTASPIGAYTVP